MTATDSHADIVDAPECASLREGRRVFERYVLEEMAGRGSVGMVWKARDQTLDRIVALMFLPDRLYRDPAARDELKRETRRCLDLVHPNIARVHDFLEDGDRAAIAMEYVEGRNLSELRMERPSRCFKPEELGVWVTELCAAIDYAHGKGRGLHRELQPGSLLIDSQGSLKVTEFGFIFSTQGHDESNHGAAPGSMSPQRVMGEPPSPSDDIYAVGATLYELLTGKPPFYGDDLNTQILEVIPESMAERRRRSGRPESSLPVAWEETIAACLAKEPQWRPASGHEIACLLGLVVEAPGEDTMRAARAERAVRAARASSSAEKWASILSTLKWLKDPRLAGALSRVAGQVRIWMAARWKSRRLNLAPLNPAQFQRLPWKPMITSAAILCASLVIGAVIFTAIRTRQARKQSRATPPVAAAAPAVVMAPARAAAVASAPAPGSAPTSAPAAAMTTATPIIAPPADPSPASAPAPVIPNLPSQTADQRALTEPIPTPDAGVQVRIETVPPGIPFQVMSDSPDAAAQAGVQGSGVSPATLILPKGAYRIVYSLPGQASRMTSVKVPAAGNALFQQEFPHGVVKVHCQPDRAEVICDGRAVGAGPVDLLLPPGRHEIGARWNGHEARTRTIELADAGMQTLAFEFHASASSSSSKRPHHSKKKPEDDSLFAKIGRSVKNLFEGDSDRKH